MARSPFSGAPCRRAVAAVASACAYLPTDTDPGLASSRLSAIRLPPNSASPAQIVREVNGLPHRSAEALRQVTSSRRGTCDVHSANVTAHLPAPSGMIY